MKMYFEITKTGIKALDASQNEKTVCSNYAIHDCKAYLQFIIE